MIVINFKLQALLSTLVSRCLNTELTSNPVFFDLGLAFQEAKRALFEDKLIPEQQDYLWHLAVEAHKRLLTQNLEHEYFVSLGTTIKETLLFPIWESIK